MKPWYFYPDEFLHRALARFGYGTGWRFCDWVDRKYRAHEPADENDLTDRQLLHMWERARPTSLHLEVLPTSSSTGFATWRCLCPKCSREAME